MLTAEDVTLKMIGDFFQIDKSKRVEELKPLTVDDKNELKQMIADECNKHGVDDPNKLPGR